jgi:retron-type reverse transcriptase
MTVAEYEQNLEANLQDLCSRVHTERHRPQPVRRVYIPRADGGQRPLGVSTLEDKIVQGAVAAPSTKPTFSGFLRLSAGTEPAPGSGIAAHGDHESARELGARCRHP